MKRWQQANHGRIVAEDSEVYEGDLKHAGSVVDRERGELLENVKAVPTRCQGWLHLCDEQL